MPASVRLTASLATALCLLSTSLAADPAADAEKAKSLRAEVAELRAKLAKAQAELLKVEDRILDAKPGAVGDLSLRERMAAYNANAIGLAAGLDPADRVANKSGLSTIHTKLLARIHPDGEAAAEEAYASATAAFRASKKMSTSQLKKIADAYYDDCLAGRVEAKASPGDNEYIRFGLRILERNAVWRKHHSFARLAEIACEEHFGVSSRPDAPPQAREKYKAVEADFAAKHSTLLRLQVGKDVSAELLPTHGAIVREGEEAGWPKYDLLKLKP